MNRALSRFLEKKKKGKEVKDITPRVMPEIQKEYTQVSAAYGEKLYTAAMNKKAADQLEQVLQNLNNEAALRNQLDAKASAEKAKLDLEPTESKGV